MKTGDEPEELVSRAPQPSFVTLPNRPVGSCSTVVDFLRQRFDHLPDGTWERRVADGEVVRSDGTSIEMGTLYEAGLRVSYFRSVRVLQARPTIPIVYEDDEILVADKPHGISVTPSGDEVGGCLLYLLWDRSPEQSLTPVHRIDRDTAGLVLFVKRARDRGAWQRLFAQGEVEKLYFASAIVEPPLQTHYWQIRSRISSFVSTSAESGVRTLAGFPSMRRWSRPSAEPNSCSEIFFAGTCLLTDRDGEGRQIGRFWVRPRTGKQHQIRLHLASLGYPILGDRLYGDLNTYPLQLHSAELGLDHPRTGRRLRFRSSQSLLHWGDMRSTGLDR